MSCEFVIQAIYRLKSRKGWGEYAVKEQKWYCNSHERGSYVVRMRLNEWNGGSPPPDLYVTYSCKLCLCESVQSPLRE